MIQEKSQYDLEKNADENYSFMYSFTNLFNQSLLSIPHARHCAKYWRQSMMKTHLAPAWDVHIDYGENRLFIYCCY